MVLVNGEILPLVLALASVRLICFSMFILNG